MIRHCPFRRVAAWLSSLGVLLHGTMLWAGEPGPPAAAPPVADVALSCDGTLEGLVMDVDGVPVPDAPVALFRGDKELGRTASDSLGRFRLGGLAGGTYRVAVGPHARLVRAWTADTAPPAAGEMALVVVGRVVRGQMPLECFFASDAFVITGMVAAMIALPIAIHSSGGGSDVPASP